MESDQDRLNSELPLAKPRLSEPINSKLGFGIHGWSIPAITTCPGRSHLCSACCYADAGFFIMPNVARCHQRNYEFSRTREFTEWMTRALATHFVQILRIHVAGDFYDGDYVRKWRRIIARSPRVRFFAYTRSWRCDDMLPELLYLAQLRNLSLWWSLDRETGPAPLVQNVHRAYMAIDDVDASLAPNDCDLVFRDDTKAILKKANGVLVCPPENGVTDGVTCTKCGVCWNKKRPPTWEALLPSIRGEEIVAP